MRKDYELTVQEEFHIKNLNEHATNTLVAMLGIILVLIGAFLPWEVAKTVLFGIGCSLIASAVVYYLTSLYAYSREKGRDITEKWGALAIYKTRGELNKSCDASVSRTGKNIDMIGFGFRSFREGKGIDIEEKVRSGMNMRILTIHPDSEFLKQREIDEHMIEGSIRATIIELSKWVIKLQQLSPNKNNVQIKYYDALPLDYYFRTDDKLFIGPYEYGKQSQQTISYEFSLNGEASKYYTEYFNYLWQDTNSIPKKDYTLTEKTGE